MPDLTDDDIALFALESRRHIDESYAEARQEGYNRGLLEGQRLERAALVEDLARRIKAARDAEEGRTLTLGPITFTVAARTEAARDAEDVPGPDLGAWPGSYDEPSHVHENSHVHESTTTTMSEHAASLPHHAAMLEYLSEDAAAVFRHLTAQVRANVEASEVLHGPFVHCQSEED